MLQRMSAALTIEVATQTSRCGQVFREQANVSARWFPRFKSRLKAVLRDMLNPLAPPGGGLEGIREVLGLVDDLTVAEFHDAHGICRSPLVGDGVFGDPGITIFREFA